MFSSCFDVIGVMLVTCHIAKSCCHFLPSLSVARLFHPLFLFGLSQVSHHSLCFLQPPPVSLSHLFSAIFRFYSDHVSSPLCPALPFCQLTKLQFQFLLTCPSASLHSPSEAIQKRLYVNEVRMLKCMCGVTWKNKSRIVHWQSSWNGGWIT